MAKTISSRKKIQASVIKITFLLVIRSYQLTIKILLKQNRYLLRISKNFLRKINVPLQRFLKNLKISLKQTRILYTPINK